MGLHESGVGHKVCCWDGQERGNSEIKLQDDGGCDQLHASQRHIIVVPWRESPIHLTSILPVEKHLSCLMLENKRDICLVHSTFGESILPDDPP